MPALRITEAQIFGGQPSQGLQVFLARLLDHAPGHLAEGLNREHNRGLGIGNNRQEALEAVFQAVLFGWISGHGNPACVETADKGLQKFGARRKDQKGPVAGGLQSQEPNGPRAG